jgi:hypothetical protein
VLSRGGVPSHGRSPCRPVRRGYAYGEPASGKRAAGRGYWNIRRGSRNERSARTSNPPDSKRGNGERCLCGGGYPWTYRAHSSRARLSVSISRSARANSRHSSQISPGRASSNVIVSIAAMVRTLLVPGVRGQCQRSCATPTLGLQWLNGDRRPGALARTRLCDLGGAKKRAGGEPAPEVRDRNEGVGRLRLAFLWLRTLRAPRPGRQCQKSYSHDSMLRHPLMGGQDP